MFTKENRTMTYNWIIWALALGIVFDEFLSAPQVGDAPGFYVWVFKAAAAAILTWIIFAIVNRKYLWWEPVTASFLLAFVFGSFFGVWKSTQAHLGESEVLKAMFILTAMLLPMANVGTGLLYAFHADRLARKETKEA